MSPLLGFHHNGCPLGHHQPFLLFSSLPFPFSVLPFTSLFFFVLPPRPPPHPSLPPSLSPSFPPYKNLARFREKSFFCELILYLQSPGAPHFLQFTLAIYKFANNSDRFLLTILWQHLQLVKKVLMFCFYSLRVWASWLPCELNSLVGMTK